MQTRKSIRPKKSILPSLFKNGLQNYSVDVDPNESPAAKRKQSVYIKDQLIGKSPSKKPTATRYLSVD